MKPSLPRICSFRALLLAGAAFASGKAVAQPGYADLALSFNNTSAFAASTGQYFKCSINLYNGGWETATNTTITNWPPAGIEFVSATSSRGTCSQSAGLLTCALGDLPPYQSATLTMEFKAIATGSYTNVAVAASATPDPNSTNSQASFITLVTQARCFGVGGTHIAFYSTPTMTLMTNNQVLVVGQHLGKTTDLYNLSTRTFSLAAGTMVGVHEYGSATVLTNGLVLLAGGATATGTKTAELYNPATQLFHQVGDMLVYSYNHYATLQPDGTVLLCGGALTTNELFNPVTETFSLAPTKQCAFNGIYLSTGKFLYFGYGRAYLYDTNTSTSVETSGFLQPRAYHTATLLQNGKVLIAGGYGTWGAVTGPLSSAELYDPITDTFTRTANLTGPREHHSACLLPDGTVLLAGGMTSESDPFSLTTAEVYDPNGTINVPGVGASDASILEGDSGTNWMQFTVWLTTTSALPVTVKFATAGGTAGTVDWGVATLDFANTNGTLTFSPGQTSAIVSVPIFGDLIREPNETLTLNLSLPTQAWIARAVATGTILDDDPMPVLTVLPAALTESDLARSNISLQVSLSLPTTSTVTVDYFTADVSASANSDYIPTNGTLAFGPGTTTLTVELPVFGDLVPEGDETFSLNLSNAQNATIGVGSALGTILNDDAVPGRLHHFDWSFISSPQVQTVPFPVTVTARDYFGGVATNVPWPVRLSAQTTNYAATNLDFEGPTLAPWTTFNYTPFEKTFDQRLADVSGLGPASMAFRMSANGGTNGIAQDIFLVGGIPYTFSANILIHVEDVGGTCWGGIIYLEVGTNSTLTALPDMCIGDARTKISLSFTPPTNGIYPLRFTVARVYWLGEYYWVYLDDVQISHPVITPTLATNFVNGTWTGVVTALQPGTNINLLANDNAAHVGASNPFDVLPSTDLGLSVSTNWGATVRTGDRLTFTVAVTNRGPTAASDVMVQWAVPPNLTFLSASNLMGTVTNEGGVLRWTLGSLAVGSNVTATLQARADLPGLFTNFFTLTNTVIDVNASNNSASVSAQVFPPLLTISDASAFETNGAATGIVFAVTLSGPSGQTITVDYFTVDGTATNNLDFASTNGTVTFAPGTTNAVIVVYAIEDILDEPNRSFTVLLTNVVNAIISDGSGAGTVLDDDPPPTITIADTALLEGDSGTTNAVFQLTLSKLAIVDVSVRCTTAPNTATTNDYTHTVTTVTFPTGTTNATYAVPVRGNTVSEPDETFFVNLTLPVNATIARTQAVGTIVNDDAVPGRLDHFAWDAIPSPRYKDWPFPVILRAVDYLGNPATNTLGTIPVKARTESGFLERLQDDFEDGDSIGWTNINASFTATVTNETAAGGVRSLRLTGSTANLGGGLRRAISNSQPNKITFSVRASRTNQIAGRLTAYASAFYRSAVFYFNNNGQMGLLDRQLGFRGVPYQSNRWYQVELALNWATQKIDCRVDGALVLTNIAFPDSSVPSIDSVLLANQDNTTSWWDDIRVFHDNLTNNFSLTPSNFTAFVSGVKSNLVTLSGTGTGTNTFLSADDSLEHVGTSGFFDLLQAELKLITPASVTEGSAPVAVQVQIPVPFPQAITVTLTSSVPSELTVPASVIISAGQTNASFNLTIIDDTFLDGTQLVPVIARATNFVSATNIVAVQDNEPAFLTLALPATAVENAGTLAGQGLVTASAPPNKPVTVALTSSDTNVVQVPASVLIPSNQLSATFNLTIVDDQKIDGPQSATVTASVVNWTNDSKTITVTDNENTDLRLTGPAQVSEDSGAIAYTARISGTLTTNLTVALASTATNTLVVPETAIIVAGQTSVVFTATALDNGIFDGVKLVTLVGSAPGFTSAATNVTVLDNEVHHLSFAAVSGVKTSSVPFSVMIYARDLNDGPITSFNGLVTLTGLAPGAVIVQPTNVTFSGGQWSGNVTLFTAEPLVTLQATGTNGLSGQSNPINVAPPAMLALNVAGGDLAFSPISERLWALVGSNSTLVPIDPLRSFVEPAVSAGPGAGRIVTSGDGRYLHIVGNSGTVVRRFDTLTRAVDLSWTNGGLSVEDIAAQPGNPNVVAVSWACPGCSPRGRGVTLYEGGVARSNLFGVNLIEFGESPDRLYGYNNDVYGVSFRTARVDASGLVDEGTLPIMGWWGDSFMITGGTLFSQSGGAFDPDTAVMFASANGWWGGQGDKAAGRFCTVGYFTIGPLTAYDLATMLPVGSVNLPGPFSVSALIRWGTNGLAFCSNSKVIVLRSTLLPSAPVTDLAVSASLTNQFLLTSNAVHCTLTVSNAGPAFATNAVLAVLLPENVTLAAVTCAKGVVQSQSVSSVVCVVTNLPVGGTAVVDLTLLGGLPGASSARVSLTGDNADLNRSNNLLTVNFQVGYVFPPDRVVELHQPSLDLAWNSNAGRIVISAHNIPLNAGSSLLLLDPTTGRFASPVPIGRGPNHLAVHPAGRYVYAGLDGESAITRVDLANRVADLKFTPPHPATDLAVKPDDPAVVVATDASWPQVLVYRDGVQLPNTVDPGASLWDRYVEFSSVSPDLLYCAPVDEFLRIQITTNGATVLEGVGGMISGFDRDMRCNGARVFTSGGRVFDPETHTFIGTVPYSGLVAPDVNSGRVFYLTGSGTTYTLTSLNFTNLQFVGSLSISNVAGTPTSLIRWGADGLAFRTTGGQIFLIRTTLADDRDQDGLADSWELQYFGSLNAPDSGPNDDPDHDGLNNFQEARAGLNPHQFDNLRLLNARTLPDGSFQFEVIGQPGNSYALLATTNLVDWTPILKFTCTDVLTILIDPASTNFGRRFYRVAPVSVVPGPRLGFVAPTPVLSNRVSLTLEGVPGFDYRVESSSNLLNWNPLTNFRSTNPLMYFEDGASPPADRKFYRAVVP